MQPDATGIHVYADEYESAMQTYVLLVGKSLEEAMLDEARQLSMALIRSMPPHRGIWHRDNSSDAKRRAERRVNRTLARLFVGKQLVGSRRVTHLFGRRDVPGLPYVVPAPERHPDVDGIYRREGPEVWRSQESTHRRIKSGKVLYVDRRKLLALRKAEHAKIGRLAAGHAAAAIKFGATVPAWIRRHSVPGYGRTQFTDRLLRVEIVNAHPKANARREWQARADMAVRARTEALHRQIPFLLRRHERLVSGS